MYLYYSIIVQLLIVSISCKDDSELGKKEGKVFNIFSIVQFKNNGCISQMTLTSSAGNSFRNGTCFTSPECLEKGGEASGSCAGGFGVCCVFMTSTCGDAVNINCSYIKNPGFPSPYTSTSGCSYTINKCDQSVCDVRLDFEQFTTNEPGLNTEADGGLCQDILTITTNTQQAVPEICGTNSGQHVYLDLGRQAADTATLAFTFGGTTAAARAANRYWDIKVTQIPCNSNYDPPNGCLQYHTGIDGRITTFNWGGTQHLRNQNYRICIRQEEGYCCAVFMQCSATAFRINASPVAGWTQAGVATDCSTDYIGIEASSQTGTNGLQSTYCGGFLNDQRTGTTDAKIKDCTAPFAVSVVTDAAADAIQGAAGTNLGACLEYTQEPCTAGSLGTGVSQG